MVNLIMVPLIIGCALFGTVGMIKLIKKFSPDQFDQNKSGDKKEDKKE